MIQSAGLLEAGTLDPTFADGGVQRLCFPEISGNAATAVLALPDKKLMVAILLSGFHAPVAMTRLHEDGTLDTEFGGKGAGYVEVALDEAYVDLVFGLSGLNDGRWMLLGQYQANESSDGGLFLVRQHRDGQLDESFGERGIRLISYLDMGRHEHVGVRVEVVARDDKAPTTKASRSASYPRPSAVQQPDGKIVLIAQVSHLGDGSKMKGIVLRLNSDGSTDTTFNGTGFAIVELEGLTYDWNSAHGVAVQSDGKVLVSGMYTRLATNFAGGYVTRFDATGHVDTRFNGGTVTVRQSDFADLSALWVRETDGRIVAVGRAIREGASNGLIIVLTVDGFFDFNFNQGQPLFSQLVPQGMFWEHCRGQEDGSLLVAGATGRGFVTEELTVITARYRSDGSLDPAFNGSGFTVFDEGEEYEDIQDMTVMVDGRIVICGFAWKAADPLPHVDGGWLIRYLT
ncbi:delta-60 repeat domain-containing protein [Pseudomonas sp. NFACC36]|uniref:delta-60 repeat domain-containing protein n=1 Tax=Pseudomonas sp. NFACC36 TaxID=1566197 RepID=UPI00090F21B5|nr:delta-60 repeat domain-containing protein [Pseudomonas sp. NFACC36]SFX39403.1 delta-60 repeat domain-containing protein [Pseudomonas sp. NFACC36]